ncbi:hypothetical protein OROGR_026449 [Orobanche gracilis]
MRPNFEAVKANGVAFSTEKTGSPSDCLLTYKRRKNAKVSEAGQVSDESSMKHINDQAQCFQNGSHHLTDLPNDCSHKHQRNIILEQIYQSLNNGEGGLKKCIENALLFHPRAGSRVNVKESVLCCGDDFSKCMPQAGAANGPQKAAEGNVGMTSDGSVDESKHCTFTELCEHTFSDIIMSEKFEQLCSLLHDNFQGLKLDKIFNLKQINSRMKENAYESSPLLFQTDIQDVWTKLQKIGSDITALAKCLSDKTATSFREKVGNSACGIRQDSKDEFLTQESDIHAKAEQTDAHTLDEAHTCRRCRQVADGRHCLVCDSCEGMYHISCTEPEVKEIPTRSWYCADCTSRETSESSHENCIACNKLNPTSQSSPPFNRNREDGLVCDEVTWELDESSKEFVSNEEDDRIMHCNVCRSAVRIKDEYLICGHSFCPHKFYHVMCLTGKQLTSYGPCWYCPSCLCRACVTDRDDDKIVLCDGCDHAYHIYCMDPPLDVIPKGKWFCRKCGSGMERIREAKQRYEILQCVSRKRAFDGKLKGGEGCLDKPGGVDMLLNVAKTLNYEENLASVGLETD